MSNQSHRADVLTDLRNAARHILNDIESMAVESEVEFGEFTEWRSNGDEGIVIAWPNLAISAAKLREPLERSRS